MSLYEEKLFCGALLPHALLEWDEPHDELPKPAVPVTGQKNFSEDYFLASESNNAGLTTINELWLEEQIDLSLFDSIPTEEKDEIFPDLISSPLQQVVPSPEQSVDNQLIFLNSIPVDEVLPLITDAALLWDGSLDTELDRVTQELMDSIADQDFLSDSCSSISGDSDILPLNPCSYGWSELGAPLSPSEVESEMSSDPQSPCSSLCDDSSDLEYRPVISRSKFNKRISPYSCSSDGRTKIVMPKIKTSSKPKLEISERKQRKKVQNKNAATKYRIKKKSEADLVNNEIQDVIDRNKELHESVDEMTREIKYLKDLIREVNKVKSVVYA